MPTDWLADLSRSFRRHRGGRAGWFLQVHRDKLRVKSSDLPPRPGESGSPAARSVTMRTPPGPATVKDALEEACEIFDGVMAGTWAWPVADAMEEDEGRVTRAMVEKLAERLRHQLVGERMAETTWQRTWGPYLAALADVAGRDNGPPEVILASYLKGWGPNSRARQMAHDRARTLWKLAGLPWPSIILALRGNGRAAADPAGVRSFSDDEIHMLRERIQASRQLTNSDLLCWDLLIVFGLRPVELQGLELRQEGGVLVAVVTRAKVSSRGRSGPRSVPAVPPEGWPADCHQLLKRWKQHGVPESMLKARSPGQALTQQLRRMRMPSDLTAYGLRHAYALRVGVELGLHVREAAALMGHSPQVHLTQYGRRLDHPSLIAKVAGAVERRAV